MTSTVLIALDASPRAPAVFAAGADFARAMRARVVLFRAIVVPPDFPPAAAMAHGDALGPFLVSQARVELLELTSHAPDVPCELRVERAIQPWRAILAAADAVGADLVVLGSHGYHGWDRVLGTTAGKVTNLARQDVLVVRDGDRGSGERPRDTEDE